MTEVEHHVKKPHSFWTRKGVEFAKLWGVSQAYVEEMLWSELRTETGFHDFLFHIIDLDDGHDDHIFIAEMGRDSRDDSALVRIDVAIWEEVEHEFPKDHPFFGKKVRMPVAATAHDED